MSDENQSDLEQDKDAKEQTQQQEKPRFVDPNSGAAPQPGGIAPTPVVNEDAPKQEEPPVDRVLDAERETQAGPAGEQPGDPDGTGLDPQDGDTDGETEGEPGGGDVTEDGEAEDGGETEDGEGEPEEKDYSDVLSKGVPEVEQYIEDHPEEKDAVIAAEKQGKNRKGITEL